MDFSDTLKALKDGCCVHRANDDKHFILKQVPAHITKEIIPKMTSLNNAAKKVILESCGQLNYNKQLLIVHKDTGAAYQYMPTAEDLFAEDWEIII